MNLSRRNILIYIGFIAAILLIIYLFFRNKDVVGKLKFTQQETEKLWKEVKYNRQLHSIDSLLLNEKYDQALEAYHLRLEDGVDPDAVQIRIDITRKLINMTRRIYAAMDSSKSMNVGDSIPTSQVAIPEEIRKYDSLNFALAKLNFQLQNLKLQLQQRSAGEYLTFNTSKGNEVHYVGSVKNGKANGKGIALLKTGSRYIGEWKTNQRNGEGVFYWPDGEYYEGDYLNDKRHGQGTYFWPNGEKFIGEWRNDQRNGEGTFYGNDGKIIASGIWKNDDLVEVEDR